LKQTIEREREKGKVAAVKRQCPAFVASQRRQSKGDGLA